jgi:transcriptional regulator with XRE-family HTH domain
MQDEVLQCNKRLGRRICELREKLNLTQEQLSEYASLSQNFISHLENGKKTASVTTLHKISKALGVPMARFFDDPETAIFRDDSVLDKSIILMVKKLAYNEKMLIVNMLKGMNSKKNGGRKSR